MRLLAWRPLNHLLLALLPVVILIASSGCDGPGIARDEHAALLCANDANCDDSDPCTVDECTGTGQDKTCSNMPIPGCCETASDCLEDGDVCTAAACMANACTTTPVADCCHTDAECADADPCTTEVCDDETNTCQVASTPACCDNDEDCADADGCTLDICQAGLCLNLLLDPTCISLIPDGGIGLLDGGLGLPDGMVLPLDGGIDLLDAPLPPLPDALGGLLDAAIPLPLPDGGLVLPDAAPVDAPRHDGGQDDDDGDDFEQGEDGGEHGDGGEDEEVPPACAVAPGRPGGVPGPLFVGLLFAGLVALGRRRRPRPARASSAASLPPVG